MPSYSHKSCSEKRTTSLAQICLRLMMLLTCWRAPVLLPVTLRLVALHEDVSAGSGS